MKATKIIIKLLALLGFTYSEVGCEMYGTPPVDMYGSPYAEFELRGTVTDKDGDPIRGIRVTVKPNAVDYKLGETLTASDGTYLIHNEYQNYGTGRLDIVAEDIDGTENGGEFAGETKNIPVADSDFVGADGWYDGKMQKTVDFTLETELNK